MFRSLKIGRWLGIDVFVHTTFWLLPLFVVLQSGADASIASVALDLGVMFAVFGCIALHEYGHAMAARWYGIRTRDITLYLFGGIASLERIPARPGPEIVIALAGPAVNVVIAAVLALFTVAIGGSLGGGLTASPGFDAFVSGLFFANVVLVVFNLIPAFPMDGGRVLRAVLCYATDRVSATTTAVIVGSMIAVAMGLYGLISGQFMLVFIAISVFMMGRSELAMVRQQATYQDAVRRADGRIPVVEPTRQQVPNDGWVFDPRTGLWTDWVNGVAVRRTRLH